MTVIAVPAQHRPVTLETGGRIIFTVRSMARIDAIPVQVGLGVMRVTRVEQTLIDLILRPNLGGMPAEAATAATALLPRTDQQRLTALITDLPQAAATRVRAWLDEKGHNNA